jgi:NTP pyrophosphatase (non-canonical NTP hydrolase)
MNSLESLKKALRDFAAERDWDQFHSPKNLAMALTAEAGELLEHFQWLTEKESASLSAEKLAAVTEEIADVQLYLLRLADKLEIDILSAAAAKIEKNAGKYPVEKSKGKATKYDQL